MKIEWNEAKNEWLKKERGISFEMVECLIRNNEIISIEPNPNPRKYPNSKALIVRINDYIHFVPFIIENDLMILKTIIPDRKLNKIYNLKDKD